MRLGGRARVGDHVELDHYNEQALAALVVSTAAINTWNRLNVIVGQQAGEWTSQWAI